MTNTVDLLASSCNTFLTLLFSLYDNKGITYDTFVSCANIKINFLRNNIDIISEQKELSLDCIRKYEDIVKSKSKIKTK